jgi:anti-anti-sigma regulatory factor
VRNNVRLCFLAYWLSARLGSQWCGRGISGEVPRIFQQLQTIRIGRLQVGKKSAQPLMTQVPKELNTVLEKLGLLQLFATVPAWAM